MGTTTSSLKFKISRQFVNWFLLIFSLMACTPLAVADDALKLSIMEFELNDLTLYPDTDAELARVATLRNLLKEVLMERYQHTVLENSAAVKAEADKGKGYLFDRPALAARLGEQAGADWVITGRLHKPSFLFVYLKAQLIDPESKQIAADFVVEIKGTQKKLTQKGVDTLALQIVEAMRQLQKY